MSIKPVLLKELIELWLLAWLEHLCEVDLHRKVMLLTPVTRETLFEDAQDVNTDAVLSLTLVHLVFFEQLFD